jgi:hypothetical protein
MACRVRSDGEEQALVVRVEDPAERHRETPLDPAAPALGHD